MADVFLVKYDATGKLKWVKTFGGIDDDIAIGVDVDEFDNVYISGYFNNQTVINGNTIIGSAWDIFVVKYNSEGDYQWLAHPESSSSELAYGIAIDSNNDVVITGWYNSNLFFGDVELPTYGGSDVLVAKYDTNGNFLWAKHAGTTSIDYGYKIDTDIQNNIYITGTASKNSDFGGVLLPEDGMYVAKYNQLGEIQALSNAKTGVISISVSPSGTGYVTGRFTGTATFTGQTPIILESFEGSDDAYLAKFNSDLQWEWVLQGWGADTDKGKAVYTDNEENAYLAGSFTKDFNLGNFTLNSVQESQDVFVAKVSPNSQVQWIIPAGKEFADLSTDIVANNEGESFVTGWFQDAISFGEINITTAVPGDLNFFIANVSPPTSSIDFIKSAESIFPNPFDNKITIKTNEKTFNINIYDISGKNIFQQNIIDNCNNQISINTNSIKSGIYFIEINSKNKRITSKIIKNYKKTK